jgi:hypothetical protein
MDRIWGGGDIESRRPNHSLEQTVDAVERRSRSD